ncbi:hypothetical protein CBOM_01024 [Ceraceosorus bombacis]|uniref:Uncharacterized protein n=1 Tax=Ceraceosorus bombacis TaxID=401625 RepID=A0A0N7L985_9BASI|nr:hypothetical protein CBOM_01024 [Ceraceosorus bombacis]
MAARASATSNVRSLIIMKDNTAKVLYNTADDYGLHSLGCGQGPALYQLEQQAMVIRLTSHQVKFLLLDRANQIHHNIAAVTRADILTRVLLGKLPITALTMLADKGHAINMRYWRQLKWLKPSKWIDSCGSVHNFMLQVSGTSNGRRGSLATFFFVVVLDEGALKYCLLYNKDFACLIYLSMAVF